MSQHARAQLNPGTVEGLLLYPLTDDSVDVALNLKGQWIRIRTIDLATSWSDIRTQLLELLRPDSFSVEGESHKPLKSHTNGARGFHGGTSSDLISN